MAKRRKKKENKSKVLTITALFFLLAVLWVWKSIEAHKLSRELTSLENTRKELIESNKHLKAELARLHSIAYIDSCVRHKYGMTYEVKERIVLFDKSGAKKKKNLNMFADLFRDIINQIKKVF